MMPENGVLLLLKGCDAVLEGHFQLSSGLHSSRYFQCARAFVDPALGTQLVSFLVPRLLPLKLDFVVGPALGGVVAAYEIARQLGARTCFTERENGRMMLRRGFSIPEGARVLVAEDVITTARSSAEVIAVLQQDSACVVAAACLVDRSEGQATLTLELPVFSLLQVAAPTYDPADCPQCQQGVLVDKPGSRP